MKWFLIPLIFAAAIACTDSQKIPEGIIDKPKMEKILWDMLQADRFVNFYVTNKNDSSLEKKKEASLVYERVFQMHGITREEFVKSYKFYLSRPDITKVLFDSIAARGEKRRSEVYSGRRNPFLEKRDSLRRADSIRRVDSVRDADSMIITDSTSTSELSDSAIRELLFK